MTVRLILVLAYLVGSGLTVVNGVIAFRSTEKRLRRYAGRVVHSDRFQKEEQAGAAEIRRRRTAARLAGRSAGRTLQSAGSDTDSGTGTGTGSTGSSTGTGEPQLTAHELAQNLVDSFYENRVSLVLAGLGLLLSTAASIVALFL